MTFKFWKVGTAEIHKLPKVGTVDDLLLRPTVSNIGVVSYHPAKKNKKLAKLLSPLKVVSPTFLLLCFLPLKESTCEARENVFYFTSKAPFILEIIKF